MLVCNKHDTLQPGSLTGWLLNPESRILSAELTFDFELLDMKGDTRRVVVVVHSAS